VSRFYLLCIAGDASRPIVHLHVTQMNTTIITTTVYYASDSKQMLILITLLMLDMFISLQKFYQKT